MTYPEIKLVDAPSQTANVLFDFNDLTATPQREVHADGFTIGTPELVGDVDAVDPLYGERLVSFTCAMTGTKPDVAAAQSALARRLLAGQGWLWVRMTSISRVLFFRTYRAEPGDLSFDLVQSVFNTRAERWELSVNLPCEPFALGAEQTLAAQTVTNDPTTGTNPTRIVLPAIAGDAPTPLRISFGSLAAASTDHRYRLSCVSAMSQRFPISHSASTGLGPDTSTVSVASAIGGSTSSVSFAVAPTLANRISSTFSSVPLGRYQALVRVALDAETTTTQLQMSIGGATGPLVPFAANTRPGVAFVANGWTWVDLGSFSIPRAPLPDTEPQGISISPGFTLRAGRTSAAGTLRIDHILLVPIDGYDVAESRTVYTSWPDAAYLAGMRLLVDGESNSVFGYNGTTPYDAQTVIEGSFVRAVPGLNNVLSIMLHVTGGSGVSDDKTLTNSVTVSYFPRFLYVGDF